MRLRKLLLFLVVCVFSFSACTAPPAPPVLPASSTPTPEQTPTPQLSQTPTPTLSKTTPAPGLPDLVWSGIPTLEPLAPIVGDKFHVKQNWKNNGPAAIASEFDIKLEIKRGNTNVFDQYIKVPQPVKPLEEHILDVTLGYTIPEPGSYKIVLTLDSKAVIVESTEDNNMIQSNVVEVPDLTREPTFSKGTDTATIAQAIKYIEKYRKGDVTLSVVDPTGQPCSGLTVEYTQIKHSFLFGVFNLTGDEGIGPLMREAGLNYSPILLDWGRVENERGIYNLGADRTRFLRQFSFSGMGHSLIWLCTESVVIPKYVFTLSYEELKDAFYHHIYKVVENYKSEIKIWNIMNEPMMTQKTSWALVSRKL